ncbi:MAG: aminotransferase class I/II-fold pyridoxal phosphate-dependent enzyme [Planctomycetota bacterium]
MNPLIDDARGRPGNDPIFAINGRAQAMRATGRHVVNASLGALLADDGRLAVLPTVGEALAAVPADRGSAYAPISGEPSFLEAVRRDAFGASPLAESSIAVATPGGTGAIYSAILNFVAPGEALYTTSFHWGPYRTIAQQHGRRVETFRMFDGAGGFDVAAFGAGLSELVERQGRALTILNFPCHNPTGYSLDEAEWRGVADALSRAAEHGPVTVLVDLAYAHFGRGEQRLWVRALEPVADRVTVLAAWTASKSYAQYGARIGALCAAVPDPDLRAEVKHALAFSSRGTWSNCNHHGMLAITELLTDEVLARGVERDRAQLVELLDARVDAFNAAASARGLRYPRYEGGFFVTVSTPDAQRTADVAAEHGVFVVPLSGVVRVALCAVPVADVPALVDAVALGVEAATAAEARG